MIGFLHGGPAALFEAKSEDVAKMYIGNIFPTVSRSSDYESRDASGPSLKPASEEKGIFGEGKSETIFQSMMGSMFPGAEVLDDDLAEEDPGIIFDTGEASDNGSAEGDDIIDSQDSQGPSMADIDYSKPVVIIYHTHATESYQPVTEGNFHSLNEDGTVREVGDVLTRELEKQGIQVIHDKTIHDSPPTANPIPVLLKQCKRLWGAMNRRESSSIYIETRQPTAGMWQRRYPSERTLPQATAWSSVREIPIWRLYGCLQTMSIRLPKKCIPDLAERS
jgi:hypothetical protein